MIRFTCWSVSIVYELFNRYFLLLVDCVLCSHCCSVLMMLNKSFHGLMRRTIQACCITFRSFHPIILYTIMPYHTKSILSCIVLYQVVTWCIIFYHIISHHIISHHIMSYYFISYCIISYRIVSYHVISYHIIYHIILYHIIYHCVLYCIVSCCITLNGIVAHRIGFLSYGG